MADFESTWRMVMGTPVPGQSDDLKKLADLLIKEHKQVVAKEPEKSCTRQAIIKSVSPHLAEGVSIESLLSNSGRNGLNQCRAGDDGWDLVKVFKFLAVNGHLNDKAMAIFADQAIQKAATL